MDAVPSQFFQTLYLEFLRSFQDYKSELSALSLETSMSIFLSLRNHIERNEEFTFGTGFKFDPFVVKNSAIFLQKYIKLGCLRGKNNEKILKMCIMIVDCFIHVITLKMISLANESIVLDYELIRVHFREFIAIVQKCKRTSENQEIKKELVSKLGLVVKLIDLRDK